MKTLRLGMIGAESSHSWNFARLCNLEKRAALRITHLWGESPRLARLSAAKGGIPEVVRDWRELSGDVDGVLILHRDGQRHAEPARHFLGLGLPVFVDKPFTRSLREAKALFSLSEKKSAPLLTFSVKPLQAAFLKFSAALRKTGPVLGFDASGPCDLGGPYGGIWFMGIHLVDSVIEVLGAGVRTAFLQRSGPHGIAALTFSEGRSATLRFVREGKVFHWRACTDGEVFVQGDSDDPNPYLAGVRILDRFFHTGTVPFSRERMLAPIAVMEALQASLRSGRVEKVRTVHSSASTRS